jgi:hypothetical protein
MSLPHPLRFRIWTPWWPICSKGEKGLRQTLNNARLRGSLEALTRRVGVTSDEKVIDPKVNKSTSITTERIEFLHQ